MGTHTHTHLCFCSLCSIIIKNIFRKFKTQTTYLTFYLRKVYRKTNSLKSFCYSVQSLISPGGVGGTDRISNGRKLRKCSLRMSCPRTPEVRPRYRSCRVVVSECRCLKPGHRFAPYCQWLHHLTHIYLPPPPPPAHPFIVLVTLDARA